MDKHTDKQPFCRADIFEALEAGRAGHADWSDPAMAPLWAEMTADPGLEELYERLRQIDQRLAFALEDVPVPQRLAVRILERLAAARAADSAVENEAVGAENIRAENIGAEDIEPVRHKRSLNLLLPRRVSRRWLLAAAVPLAAAACLFVAVSVGIQKQTPYSGDVLLHEAIRLFTEEVREPTQTAPPPDAYPFSRDVLRVAGTQWRTIPSAFSGRKGVAYDLPGDGGVKATLYAVKCSVDGLPVAPPTQAGFTTATCSAAAWQDGDLVYVLVVRGGSGAYRSYLNPVHGPVT